MPARPGASQAALPSAFAGDRYAADIWTCLNRLHSISSLSALRHGRLGLLVNRASIAEPEQFIGALRDGCEIVLVLGRGFTSAPDALFQSIIELVDVVRRGTRAEFMFQFEDPQACTRLEELWQRNLWGEVDGFPAPMPRFLEFPAIEPPDPQQGPWYPRP